MLHLSFSPGYPTHAVSALTTTVLRILTVCQLLSLVRVPSVLLLRIPLFSQLLRILYQSDRRNLVSMLYALPVSSIAADSPQSSSFVQVLSTFQYCWPPLNLYPSTCLINWRLISQGCRTAFGFLSIRFNMPLWMFTVRIEYHPGLDCKF